MKHEHLLVINGDTIFKLNYTKFYNQFISLNCSCLIALSNYPHSKRYGFVTINNDKEVIKFFEKDQSFQSQSYINAAIYLFKRSILHLILSQKYVSMEYELLPNLINLDEHNIYSYITNNKIIDIGTPESYIYANNQAKLNLLLELNKVNK